MKSLLTSLYGIKALVVVAICSGSLTACYVQPHSQVGLSSEDATTPMQSAPTDDTKIAGSYTLVQKPDAADVVIEVVQANITSPAKNIQLHLNLQQKADTANPSQSQPVNCNFQGTATLMGHDALHGLIYTVPVSSINTDDTELNLENNKGLLFFRFKDNILSLDSNNPEALSGLCNSQVQLKGDYTKLK